MMVSNILYICMHSLVWTWVRTVHVLLRVGVIFCSKRFSDNFNFQLPAEQKGRNTDLDMELSDVTPWNCSLSVFLLNALLYTLGNSAVT